MLKSNYRFCCKTFLALDNLEFHLLSFAQRTEAFALNSAVVNEDIPAAVALNEAVAFRIIEPFDGSSLSIGHE